jgi:hypothetical protein
MVIYSSFESPDIIEEFADIEWVDFSKDLGAAIEFSYSRVKSDLQKIKSRSPGFFEIEGYSFFEALVKDMFWAQFNESLVDYKLSTIPHSFEVRYDCRKVAVPGSTFPLLRQLAKILFSGGSGDKAIAPDVHKGKVAIRVNNLNVISLLGALPAELGKDRYFYFCTGATGDVRELRKVSENFMDLSGIRLTRRVQLLSKWFEMLSFGDRKMGGLLMNRYIALVRNVEQYEQICRTGCRAVLMNAGENDGEGNIMAQVAKRFHVRSANFMNGTKAFDVVNENTTFEMWFMHDESMRELAVEKYGIDPVSLPVTGHLLQDVSRNYKYSGLLDRWQPERYNFIIAFFTSPLFFEENAGAYSVIGSFLDRHPDAVAFVKPHPREKNFHWDQGHERIIRLDYRKEKSENEIVLFDMLSVANCSISIASTVSFQASWFGIQSLTFELRTTSRLPYTDGQKVRHIKTGEELVDVLEESYKNCRGKERLKQRTGAFNEVALRILNLLLH